MLWWPLSIFYLQCMVNTSPCKEKIFIHKIQLPASVGRAHLRWTEENRKTVRAIIPRSQEERDQPACYQRALKKWLWRERVQVLICQPLKRFDAFWEKKIQKQLKLLCYARMEWRFYWFPQLPKNVQSCQNVTWINTVVTPCPNTLGFLESK